MYATFYHIRFRITTRKCKNSQLLKPSQTIRVHCLTTMCHLSEFLEALHSAFHLRAPRKSTPIIYFLSWLRDESILARKAVNTIIAGWDIWSPSKVEYLIMLETSKTFRAIFVIKYMLIPKEQELLYFGRHFEI